MPIDKSKLVLTIAAHRKLLDEHEQTLLKMKQKNPNLLNDEDARKVENSFLNKRQEYLDLAKAIGEISARLKVLSNNSSTLAQTEVKNLLNELQMQRERYEQKQIELEDLGKKVNDLSSEESRSYRRKYIECNIVKKKLIEIEQTADSQILEQVSNLQAAEKRSSPFDPGVINKNLFENIKKFPDWQKEFSGKYNLIISENLETKKAKFSSDDKNVEIDVTQEKISGSWKKENELRAIVIMVELYIKTIENQKVNKHLIEAKNDKVTKVIEVELARQLHAQGYAEGEINNKKIVNILSSNDQEDKMPEDFHSIKR